jgi:hypothetical protein
MHDQDLERVLRRYRPADPPIGLRKRCILQSVTDRSRRTWPWAAAAAALLAATVASVVATASLDPLAVQVDESERAIDRLAALLGGDDVARRLAEIIVIEEQPEETP